MGDLHLVFPVEELSSAQKGQNVSMPMKAVKLLREFRNGSSLPVLIQTEAEDLYVVKWFETGEGPVECLSDWICLNLAEALGIPVPDFSLIEVPSDLSEQVTDSELRELIFRNQGLNLGLKYLENAEEYSTGKHCEISPELKNRIFLFDLLLLNIDRTDRNPNMLCSANQIYCIDFSASAEIRNLVVGEVLSEEGCLPIIRRHPFYNPEPGSLSGTEVNSDILYKITRDIPENWRSCVQTPEKLKEELVFGLQKLLTRPQNILRRRLDLLKEIPLEAEWSMKQKRVQNREDFLRRHNLLRTDRK
ncbi:MAG: HipA family kinase [Fibrobacterota bacterium]